MAADIWTDERRVMIRDIVAVLALAAIVLAPILGFWLFQNFHESNCSPADENNGYCSSTRD